ncbi:MAG: serine/threonine protein kinase [Candidatus Obscuribacterales bacterium]|nr:serine/threonine protein kinase [Candidatus Obscuribacterales bacterium]
MDENNILLSTPDLSDLVSEVQVSGYNILERIGSGGTAIVYKAKHTTTGRSVAIKVLERSPTTTMEKFSSEAKLLSRLNHPSICQIYSFNQSPAGVVYFAMEWIEGESLTEYLKHGELSDLAFEQLMRPVLEAVRYAHAEGILHRDLKPDNIMVLKNTNDSVGGLSIKVIDFGLARALHGEERNVVLTQSLSGSPAYMSPEQCRQERGDERSDIYSLGVIMYQFLTGTRPFEGDTAMKVMYNHLNETVPPLETPGAKLSSFRPLVMRCLEKAPENRYQTMSELLEAFDLAVARPRRAACLPRKLLILLAMVVLVLAATIFRTINQRMQSKHSDPTKEAPTAQKPHPVSSKAQFLQAVSDDNTALTSKDNTGKVKLLNEVLAGQDRQLRMLSLAKLITLSEDPKERTKLTDDLVNEIANTHKTDERIATRHNQRLADCAARLEDANQPEERHKILVALSNASFIKDDRQFCRQIYRYLYRDYCRSNQLNLAEQTRKKALATCTEEESKLLTLLFEIELALAAECARDYREAELRYTKATNIEQGESLRTVKVLLPAASFFLRHGQIDRAEKLYTKVMETTALDTSPEMDVSHTARDRSWYRVYREYARSLFDAGLILNDRRLIQKALVQCKKCLALENLTTPSQATIHELQAQILLALANTSAASKSIELAAKGDYAVDSSLETRLSKSKTNFIKGEIDSRRNQVALAREHFKKAISQSRSLELDARDPFLHNALTRATELVQPGDLPAQTIAAARKALSVEADGFRWNSALR